MWHGCANMFGTQSSTGIKCSRCISDVQHADDLGAHPVAASLLCRGMLLSGNRESVVSQRASDNHQQDVSNDVHRLPLTSSCGEGRICMPLLSPSPCDLMVATPQAPLPMPLPTRSQLRWQDDTPAWIFLAIKAWLVYMKTRETPW
jgi:hypothetical protein